MSILFEHESGWILSHAKYIENIYKQTKLTDTRIDFKYKDEIFEINSIYLRTNQNANPPFETTHRKRKHESTNENIQDDIREVQDLYKQIMAKCENIFVANNSLTNEQALETAKKCYALSAGDHFLNMIAGNNDNLPLQMNLFGKSYIYPPKTHFYCKDVKDMPSWKIDEKFNIIVMDPPWRNKYIRRKNSQVALHSYKMLYNEELKDLPITKLLANDGLVIVWCTNSPNHLNAILNVFFPKWNVKFLTKYYWLKVTKSGIPVCQFSSPCGKQPFEQIIIGANSEHSEKFSLTKKIIISVPSALHSHKPPLTEVFKEFITPDSKCLEIFARSLLPNWTSWGLEVCRFQHESLFVKCGECTN